MATLNLPKQSRVYLDANLLIYAVERILPYADLLRDLFAQFDRGELVPVTSELSLAEVMVKPFQANSLTDQQAYQALLRADGPIELVPIDRDVLVAAAQLRARHRILLADAIHVASANESGCDYFLTNDQRLKAVTPPRVVLLGDYVG